MSGADLAATVGEAMDDDVVSVAGVSGGDVAQAYRMQLTSGRFVFAKTKPDAPADFFDTEAAGLRWLREPGAVAVPEVLAVGPDHLVLEWIEELPSSRRPDDAEAELGRSLAALHRAGAPSFGREDRRTTGSRGLPNDPVGTWSEHYAANRLEPIARLWRDTPGLPVSMAERLHDLSGRLVDLGVPDEPPARLHGDLWSGNRITGRRTPERGTGDRAALDWLIDPAAHGGHREFDLAMMRLFGGFGAECFEAYDESFPLAVGWETRVPLHQLAPLAIHAIKFGGGYVAATDRALDQVAALG